MVTGFLLLNFMQFEQALRLESSHEAARSALASL
jgi:hypothetical protein